MLRRLYATDVRPDAHETPGRSMPVRSMTISKAAQSCGRSQDRQNFIPSKLKWAEDLAYHEPIKPARGEAVYQDVIAKYPTAFVPKLLLARMRKRDASRRDDALGDP